MQPTIEYSEIGIAKIGKQAATDLTCVRCPRDSVVMRILSCRVVPAADPTARSQPMDKLPKGKEWLVRHLDFECPACRRRAMRIAYAPDIRQPEVAAAPR